MSEKNQTHEWSMINVRSGYIVTEGCAQCGARTSFFTREDLPPKDSFVEGKHIWKYRGSSQAVKFDLECRKTGLVVKLDSVVAMMLCTVCDPDCEAGRMARLTGPEKTWVYVSLCADTSHLGGKCSDEKEVKALEEYFNQGIKTPGKRIRFVPCKLISNFDGCLGEIIADTGLTEIY